MLVHTLSSGFISPRVRLGRFLEGIDDPDARVIRGGRLAALGFITGAITAVPVNLLLTGFSLWEQFLAFLVLLLGLICLLVEWEHKGAGLLYFIGLCAIAVISAATVVSTLAFAIFYVFVAVIVALVAPFRMMLVAIGLISLGLLAPALIGPNAGEEAFAFALVCASTLLVTSTLAYQLVRMLEQSRQSFWTLSRQDPLTGVGNYRALRERLEEEIARHRRHSSRLTVAIFDLDEFKKINDTQGHMFGDRVLVEVAHAIRKSMRREDTVYRQGGDEFAVIAPETGRAEMQPVIDRVRESVEVSSPGGVAITIGSGVASFPDDGGSAEELIGLADSRLMEAKRDRAEALSSAPLP